MLLQQSYPALNHDEEAAEKFRRNLSEFMTEMEIIVSGNDDRVYGLENTVFRRNELIEQMVKEHADSRRMLEAIEDMDEETDNEFRKELKSIRVIAHCNIYDDQTLSPGWKIIAEAKEFLGTIRGNVSPVSYERLMKSYSTLLENFETTEEHHESQVTSQMQKVLDANEAKDALSSDVRQIAAALGVEPTTDKILDRIKELLLAETAQENAEVSGAVTKTDITVGNAAHENVENNSVDTGTTCEDDENGENDDGDTSTF